MLSKRQFIFGALAAGGTAGAAALMRVRLGPAPAHAADGETFEITRSEAEWREILTPEEYRILRENGTERAYSSPLNDEHRKGTYHCAACDKALFRSQTKFDSGTGWPSFTAPIEGAIGTSEDRSWFVVRTEVHCARCGGHLGHVFDDGPPPTGLRYCINGVALDFKPAEGAAS